MSWELLVTLLDGFGQDESASEFSRADARELEHEERVRGWLAAALNQRSDVPNRPRLGAERDVRNSLLRELIGRSVYQLNEIRFISPLHR